MNDGIQMKGRNKKVSVVIPPLTQGLAGIQKHAHTLTFAHTHTHDSESIGSLPDERSQKQRDCQSVLNAEKYPNR